MWHHCITVLFQQSIWSVSVCCKMNHVLTCKQLLKFHCICVLKDGVDLYTLMDRVGQLNRVVKERQSFIFLLYLDTKTLGYLFLGLANWCGAKSEDKYWESLSQSVNLIGLLQFHEEIIKKASDFPHILLSYPSFPVQDTPEPLGYSS